ncbi:neprilysin-1-like isoform X1 [Dermacentor andersoni]|uniref:neprilysin-1-like isoform X1 n=1 Tax=Dermacentor andersoni TaxID=34620 RepID=UPI002155A2CA|nr:neprilysin-1-like isoform X1 [Dermacentor andersoni]
MAQSVSSATPTTGSSFPPNTALAARRTATDRKTNITSSAATSTNRSSVGGTSSARTTSASQPPAPLVRARGASGAQETEGGTRPAPASSPAPSSQASSECGDLNLVPPPRPGRRVIPQLLSRLQGSRRLAIVLSAALAAALLTVPMVAILVSGKTIAWRSSGSVGTALYLCNDSVCHAEAHYFDDKLDSAVSPCDDYYAHVCSSHWQRLIGGADLRSAPYASQSPGYAYQALHELAAAYVAQDADRVHQNRHHFGHQILLFVASCAKESSRTSRETDSLTSVLRYLDLEGWPFDVTPRGRKNVAHIAGKVAGSLAIFPFVTVGLERLPSLRDDQQRQPPRERLLVVLGQAQLLLSSHEHMDGSRAMDWYREVVGRALKFFYKGREDTKIIDAIVELEAGLARSIESQPSRKPPLFFRVSLGSVPGGSRWDWVLFMNGVLKGSAAAAAIQPVAVRSMLYLQRLARLTQATPTAVLLNYVGYRLMVAMAPFLPGPTGEHLVSLSVEGRRIPGMERLQACVQLVEKVFGAALTVMLRHATPFLSQSDTARKMLGLAHSAADAMAHFIKKAPWLSAEDVNATLSRLSQTSLSLGVPREQPGESELGHLFVDVPMLNERSLLESYFHMKTAVQRRYWSALQRVRRNSSAAARDGAWNNGAAAGLHDVSSFDLAYRHDPERNSVLLPYGVLGFLARVQDVLPMHVPRFLPYALRGLFAAVADMQTVHDDRPSWSRATSLRFAHLSWCFLRQYGEVLSAEAGSPAGGVTDDFLAEIVEDNAVLEPLYRVYVRSFPLREGRPALFRLPTLRALSTDELFFVNFALGQCDQPATAARNGTAARQILFRERLPAKFKVNVPLRNSEHFARVYGCKKGSPMNPVRSCSVWTATG